jgi:hypothetical protein
LVLVSNRTSSGLIFSFILCFSGIFAFVIHTYFLKKGRKEFDQPISKWILGLISFVSVIQLVVTLFLLVG